MAPASFDPKRYPHYGGRKRPGSCAVCHRDMLVSEIDTPDETGERMCPVCIREVVDLAWENYKLEQRKPRPDTSGG